MAWWQKLFTVAVVVAQGIVAAIQFVEHDSFGSEVLFAGFADKIIRNRLLITLICGIFGGAGAIIAVFFQPRRTREAYRESLVDGIYEQVLDNDRTKARITIFRDAGFWRTNWYRFKDCWSLYFKRKRSIRDAWDYATSSNYIYIRYRWGTEYKKSKTYFCVNRQTASKCQGVAGQVRQREETITVTLPRIDDIKHSEADETDPRIVDYMNQGHISDIYVLRSLKRPAPFIFGALVSTNGGKKKYVLVIDSWADKTPFVLPVKKKVLPAYIKQLSAALNTRS